MAIDESSILYKLGEMDTKIKSISENIVELKKDMDQVDKLQAEIDELRGEVNGFLKKIQFDQNNTMLKLEGAVYDISKTNVNVDKINTAFTVTGVLFNIIQPIVSAAAIIFAVYAIFH